MKKNIFLGFLIFFVVFFGYVVFSVYLENHTYYGQMFATPKHRWIFLGGLVFTLIPLLYLLFAKKASIQGLLVSLFVGLLCFSFVHTGLKGGTIGPSGAFMTIVSTFLLFATGVYFFLGVQGLGSYIGNRLIKFKEHRLQEMFFSFGIGLAAILLFTHALILVKLLYRPIVWIVFLGLSFCIRKEKRQLHVYKENIEKSILSSFSFEKIKTSPLLWGGIILLCFSILYYYFGFNLSFIPYSTARDANHAYMYFPKILAENHGMRQGGPTGTSPMLRYSFISFRFSLMEPIKGWWLGASTFPVAMNFLSGVLVLFFGLGLGNEAISFFTKEEKDTANNIRTPLLYSIRCCLLLRLTSGMGAFLVFVDNKTDLGVMALTLLALLSGFIALGSVEKITKQKGWREPETVKYVTISGLFFALAGMAKMSAFQDALLFGLLLCGLRTNIFVSIGGGIAALGLLSYVKALAIPFFIPETQALPFIIRGTIILVIGIVITLVQQKTKNIQYILLWGASLVITLFVCKGPQVVYSLQNAQMVSPGNIIKWLLMAKGNEEKPVRIAGNIGLSSQNQHAFITPKELKEKAPYLSIYCPQEYIEPTDYEQNLAISPAQCKETFGFLTGDRLFTGLQENVGGGLNEDFQRYIGFGQRSFSKPGNKSLTSILDGLGFGILNLFVSRPGCHGRNPDAKKLCEHAEDIRSFNIPALEKIQKELPQESDGALVLGCILGKKKTQEAKGGSGVVVMNFKDEVQALESFYKDKVIEVSEVGGNKIIAVPYRYFVPLNVSVINSLQNLSSYYTDVGFILFFCFFFVIVGTIYLCFHFSWKKEKGIIHTYPFVLTLHITTCIGRIIRRAIGSAILRYGVGLIAWTMLANASMIYLLFPTKKEVLTKGLLYAFLGITGFRVSVQFFFNFMRISSQGGEYNFVRYKGNTAKQTTYSFKNGGIVPEERVVGGYDRKDVFDLQFGHYNQFIEQTKNRADTDGVYIAGTYLQYFLPNQQNIILDQLLTELWRWTSDYDVCKSYLRIKEKNIKYIVIDPNIMTVVMGGGNESLKNRFFAKIDPVSGEIEKQGTMTMMAHMIHQGYVKMMYANNLSSKYAYLLSNEDILTLLQVYGSGDFLTQQFLPMAQKDMIQFRAKMALARFFPETIGGFMEFTARIFQQRLFQSPLDGLQDMADVFGKRIDAKKTYETYQKIISSGYSYGLEQEVNKTLTQDELFILSYYAGISRLLQQGTPEGRQQFQEFISSFLQQSMASSSQLMVFALE